MNHRTEEGSMTESTYLENQDVEAELLRLVDEGLLEMSVNEHGQICYWTTEAGLEAFGISEMAESI